MFEKVLVSDFNVPEVHAGACASILTENGRETRIVWDISGSPHVMLDQDDSTGDFVPSAADADDESGVEESDEVEPESGDEAVQQGARSEGREEGAERTQPKAIFLGHGKNRAPLDKLVKQLATFQIPNKVAIAEPNLGRPIPHQGS